MARILLFTESEILAQGFVSLIDSVPGLEVDSICNNANELLESNARRNPDVILIDFIPEENLDLVYEIRKNAPETKTVLWVHGMSFGLAFQAMKLGIRGILRKSFGADLTIKCLQKVASGEVWFEQDLSASFLEATTVELSPREGQLTILVSQGLKNKEIAATLGLAEATIRMYLSTIFRKLGVKDRYELAIFGLKNLAVAGRSIHTAATSDDPAGATPRRPLRFLAMEGPSGAKGTIQTRTGQGKHLHVVRQRQVSG